MGLTLTKQNARWVTGIALIVANLMPLAGVVLLGWEPGALLFAYWLESAVVGFFNVIKMAQAEGPVLAEAASERREVKEGDLRRLSELRQSAEGRSVWLGRILGSIAEAAKAQRAQQQGSSPASVASEQPISRTISSVAKVPLMLFFLVHYGIFMTVHVVFLLSFFSLPRLPVEQWLLTTLLLFTSHGVSYLVYFLGRGEYRVISTGEQMGRPYGRIAVMHITIIFGAMLIQALQAPALVLVLLVSLKILVDLVAHIRSHARFERSAEAA